MGNLKSTRQAQSSSSPHPPPLVSSYGTSTPLAAPALSTITPLSADAVLVSSD